MNELRKRREPLKKTNCDSPTNEYPIKKWPVDLEEENLSRHGNISCKIEKSGMTIKSKPTEHKWGLRSELVPEFGE